MTPTPAIWRPAAVRRVVARDVPVGEWPVSSATYHKRTDVLGHGMFEVFLESPRRFEGIYIDRSLELSGDTPDRFLGRLLHTALLEPREFSKRYFLSPELAPDGEPWNRSRTDHAKWWAQVVLSSLGKAPVSQEQMDLVALVQRRLPANEEAYNLARHEGRVEAGLRWLDHDVPCKALRDKLIVAGRRRVIVDVKSMDSVSPADFRRWAGRWSLHRTAAWYLRGERAVYPEDECSWLCWAVSKDTGESALYDLDDEDLAVAAGEIERGLERFAAAVETGIWRAPWESGVTRVKLSPGSILNSDL